MSAALSERRVLFSRDPKTKILHLTWIAFFVTMVVWFNQGPLMASMRTALGLTEQQINILLILNVALTIPARVIIGMLVDQLGPRRIYSGLLALTGVLCFFYALAPDFETMALTRFLLGSVGAGFVVGIRMVGEWFPAKEVGFAEGIYGGWGNFGKAAGAMTLPAIALIVGGDDGWRWALASSGVLALAYAGIYYRNVQDTPDGAPIKKPKRSGAMEVTSKGDFVLYCLMQAPMLLALALLAWKLGPANLAMFSSGPTTAIYALLGLLYVYLIAQAWRVNRQLFAKPAPSSDRYRFAQVAVLDLAYLVTFGSELAAISMLPLFFQDNFGVSQVSAGLLAGSFAFTNLIARPAGGLISDRFGRRRVLLWLLAGTACGYLAMAQITGATWLVLAMVATLLCSGFVQACSGAVIAMVPLIRRDMTGQIAGMVGAYGTVGAVVFLTVLSFVSPQAFFMVIGLTAAATLLAAYLLLEKREERTSLVEEAPIAISMEAT